MKIPILWIFKDEERSFEFRTRKIAHPPVVCGGRLREFLQYP